MAGQCDHPGIVVDADVAAEPAGSARAAFDEDVQRQHQRAPSPRWRRTSHSDASSASRSEEHTSELQSLMRISYAVFCLKKKNTQHKQPITPQRHYYIQIAHTTISHNHR